MEHHQSGRDIETVVWCSCSPCITRSFHVVQQVV